MAQTALESKIERLQKELKEAKAAKSMAARKERNGQLFSFGVMIEKKYKTVSPEQREAMRKEAAELLDDRNRDRAMKGFDRLDAEFLDGSSEKQRSLQFVPPESDPI